MKKFLLLIALSIALFIALYFFFSKMDNKKYHKIFPQKNNELLIPNRINYIFLNNKENFPEKNIFPSEQSGKGIWKFEIGTPQEPRNLQPKTNDFISFEQNDFLTENQINDYDLQLALLLDSQNNILQQNNNPQQIIIPQQNVIPKQNIIPVLEQKFNNDNQNVHDSSLVKSMKNSWQKLEDICTKCDSKCKKEIEDIISKNIKAQQTYHFIQNATIPKEITVLNTNLSAIMATVWKYSKKYKIEDVFVENMADCIDENTGSPFCTMGIAMRLIGSLSGINENVRLFHDGIFREEMLHKASKIHMSDPNNPNIKDVIYNSLKIDYVDSGILIETSFKNEVTWLDSI